MSLPGTLAIFPLLAQGPQRQHPFVGARATETTHMGTLGWGGYCWAQCLSLQFACVAFCCCFVYFVTVNWSAPIVLPVIMAIVNGIVISLEQFCYLFGFVWAWSCCAHGPELMA